MSFLFWTGRRQQSSKHLHGKCISFPHQGETNTVFCFEMISFNNLVHLLCLQDRKASLSHSPSKRNQHILIMVPMKESLSDSASLREREFSREFVDFGKVIDNKGDSAG